MIICVVFITHPGARFSRERGGATLGVVGTGGLVDVGGVVACGGGGVGVGEVVIVNGGLTRICSAAKYPNIPPIIINGNRTINCRGDGVGIL
ncbi:MAG: hypothetical protein QNJ47_23535 [Nostocaceae cyanobacterium]|nr:hypothetical protein [Nostocaceae cyanobacterium]